jgi:hypothetical protein
VHPNGENSQKRFPCVFIFAYDNNGLYWIEKKLFLFIIYLFTFCPAAMPAGPAVQLPVRPDS